MGDCTLAGRVEDDDEMLMVVNANGDFVNCMKSKFKVKQVITDGVDDSEGETMANREGLKCGLGDVPADDMSKGLPMDGDE
eukprot:5830570-Pleurochrysis_carterae.AAC.1